MITQNKVGYNQISNNSASIAIILVNYNGWQDTIECLESIYRLEYPNYCVYICDNNSTDGSIQYIREWAIGNTQFTAPSSNPLSANFSEPIPKPQQIIVIQHGVTDSYFPLGHKDQLILVNIDKNLGFAGANNVGIQYALETGGVDYFWLLNNDTIVTPDSLNKLMDRTALDQTIGICGSTLLYYDNPDEVQTLAGSTYDPVFAIARFIKPTHETTNYLEEQSYVETNMDMVSGASMFVSIPFIRDIGLLSEDYFLFNEEIDWAIRAKGKYRLGYAPQSLVYHKKGRSIGSTTDPRGRSKIADYYNIRSRLIFTKKYYPRYLLTVYLGLLGVMFNRLRRGQLDRVVMILRLIIDSVHR